MLEVILIILFTLFFVWISWWKLDWAIVLTVLFLPAYLLRFQVWFMPVTILEVMVLVVFLVWAIKQIQNSKFKNQNVGIWWPWEWLTLLWVLAGVVAVLISPDTRQALGLWKAYILEPVLFFIVFINVIRTEKQIRSVLWALGALTVIVGFVALLQYDGLVGIPSPYGQETPMRATSVFPFPTAVGKLLGPIVALFLGIVLARDSKGNQRISGEAVEKKQSLLPHLFPLGVLAFGVMALLFSFSRGAIIGIFASLIFISFFSRWKKWLWVGIILMVVLSLLIPSTRQELLSVINVKDTSADVHVVMWEGTVRIIRANPITGTGLASFPIVYEKYKEASHTEFFPNPDHLILTLWIEMGLAGLIIFFWLVIRFLKAGIRLIKHQNPEVRVYAVGLLAAMVAILVHGFFDTPYFKNDLAVAFWVLVGLVAVLSKLQDEKGA